MLLGEPPQTAYDLRFSLLGIPIRVHPLFWLVALLMGSQRRDPASVLIWIVAVFLTILVHELGHALSMRSYGFHPWITLYGMGGLASHDQGYNARSKGSEPLGQILTCLAGPAAGFLLAAVLLAGLFGAGYGEQIDFHAFYGLLPRVWLPNPRFEMLLNDVLFVCVVWGIINLLPIYPLDGGQIAREILVTASPREGIRWSLMLSTLAAGLMAGVGFFLLRSIFVAMLFGYLAYTSYATLQAHVGRGPW
jgi:Zn-dependent protease